MTIFVSFHTRHACHGIIGIAADSPLPSVNAFISCFDFSKQLAALPKLSLTDPFVLSSRTSVFWSWTLLQRERRRHAFASVIGSLEPIRQSHLRHACRPRTTAMLHSSRPRVSSNRLSISLRVGHTACDIAQTIDKGAACRFSRMVLPSSMCADLNSILNCDHG